MRRALHVGCLAIAFACCVLGPEARGQTHVYDAAGRLRWSTQPGGASTTYTYDAAGNILSVANVLAGQDTDGDGIPDSFEFQWTGANSTTSMNATLDPDGDGVVNLLEYAFARDPKISDVLKYGFALTGASIETIGGSEHYLHITFVRPKQGPGTVDYFIEVSTTLDSATWSGDPAYVEVVSTTDLGGGIERVKGRSKLVTEVVPRVFLRIRVEPKP